MQRPDLEGDERFVDGATRARHQQALIELIETWAATFDDNEAVLAVLEQHRVPSAPVLNPLETLDHEYYRDRGMVREVSDPILGQVEVPGFPFKFSAQTEVAEGVAPLLGEHNAEILEGMLGMSAEDIDALRENAGLTTRPV